METNLYLAFVGVSVAVIVVPGPSVLLIVSNGLQLGPRAGMSTVVGVSAAMIIQLAIALAGVASLVRLLEQGLDLFRALGIAYLVYLGVRRWRNLAADQALQSSADGPRETPFAEGFLVALTNPTTLLFFVAYFPQFLDPAAESAPQLWLMASTFWLLALVIDIAYSALASRMGKLFQDPRWVLIRSRVSGAITIAAALLLVFI